MRKGRYEGLGGAAQRVGPVLTRPLEAAKNAIGKPSDSSSRRRRRPVMLMLVWGADVGGRGE